MVCKMRTFGFYCVITSLMYLLMSQNFDSLNAGANWFIGSIGSILLWILFHPFWPLFIFGAGFILLSYIPPRKVT